MMHARTEKDPVVDTSAIEVVVAEQEPPVKMVSEDKAGEGRVPGLQQTQVAHSDGHGLSQGSQPFQYTPPPPTDISTMPVLQQAYINGQWVWVQVPAGQPLQPVSGQPMQMQPG